jgi:two-component system, NarL family, response regulator LiaR
MKIRVVIVDDHEIVLKGLQLVLREQPEVELVGVAADGPAALQCISRHGPDVVLLDFDLPGSNGLVVARQILAQNPKTKIIIFSAYIDPAYVQEAVQLGVSGYLGKVHKSGEVAVALKTVQRGQLYLCAEAATMLAEDYREKADTTALRLTDREKQVLKGLADGQSTKEMASALRVSVKTVESHRKKIMSKLGLHSVAELTKYAIRQGLTRV